MLRVEHQQYDLVKVVEASYTQQSQDFWVEGRSGDPPDKSKSCQAPNFEG